MGIEEDNLGRAKQTPSLQRLQVNDLREMQAYSECL